MCDSIKVNKQQYNSIDLVKFLMAFAVIAIHTCPLNHCKNELVLSIYNNLVNIAVPFFFLASGYLLSRKITFSDEVTDIAVIKRYMWKILKMYLLWMVIYTPLSVWHMVERNISFAAAVREYLQGLFFKGLQYNSWPLWYLLSTVYTLLIIILLRKLKVGPKGLLVMGLIFSIISIGTDCLADTQSHATAVVMAQQMISNTVYNGRMFGGMIYLPIGIYLGSKKQHNRFYGSVMVICFILNCMIENFVVSSCLLIFTSIGFFEVIANLDLKEHPAYYMCRKMSIILYLIHMYIWSIYYKVVYGVKTHGWDSFLITSVLGCVLALVYLKFKDGYQRKKIIFNHKK